MEVEKRRVFFLFWLSQRDAVTTRVPTSCDIDNNNGRPVDCCMLCNIYNRLPGAALNSIQLILELRLLRCDASQALKLRGRASAPVRGSRTPLLFLDCSVH